MTDAMSGAPANRVLFVDASEILCGTIAREVSRLDGCSCMAWTTTCAEPTREIADFAPGMVIADPAQADIDPQALRQSHLDLFGDHESVAYIPSNASGIARSCIAADYAGIISRGAGLNGFVEALESMIAGGFYVDGVFGQIDAGS